MTAIHFNEAEHLRITKVEQFIPGRRYLMVHNRKNTDDKFYYPPYCQEVYAIGTEFVSFRELDRRGNNVLLSDSEHCTADRWMIFYVRQDADLQTSVSAADHGFTDSVPHAHSMNFYLDLAYLAERDIDILREVSPGTDMSHERDPLSDYLDRAYDDDVIDPHDVIVGI